MDFFHLLTNLFAYYDYAKKFFKTLKIIKAQPLIVLAYVIRILSSRMRLYFFLSSGVM